MTRDEIDRVTETSDVLMRAGPGVADRFYERLFGLAPEARALFADDLSRQKFKLTDTLASMVRYMSNPGAFAALASDLGRRHVGFGARPEHYGPVGTALLAALADVLADRFTPDVEAAWAALYGEVSTIMIAAQSAADTSGG